jgi:hypothetical protein
LRRFATAFTVATAGLALTAAAAQAVPSVGIGPSKSCYFSNDKVTVLGGGFTPNGLVGVAIDGESLGQLPANATGGVAGTITFGRFKGAKAHTITGTDAGNPALTASMTFYGTTPQVTVKPANARADKKRKMRGYGFLSGPKAYMHVRNHGVSTDTRVGRPKGPCGTWGPTKRRIVGAGAASGNYRVQFDHKQSYSKKTKGRLVYTLRVFRTFKAARASGFNGASPLSAWTQVG